MESPPSKIEKEKRGRKDTPDSIAGKKRKRSEVEVEGKDPALTAVSEEIPVPGDEAPLSHKQLRKAKKSFLNTNGEDVQRDEKFSKGSKADVTEKPVRQNSVWVGNLAFKTSESDIKEFFSKCGTVTRVHMPRKTTAGSSGGMRGQNMGFAYVDFDTTESRDKAVKLSESPLHGRKLLIKDGNDYRGRPTAAQKAAEEEDPTSSKPNMTKTAQKLLKSQKHPPCPTLFMGNLGFETTKETITEMLEGHHKTAHAPAKGVNDDEQETKGEQETKKEDMLELGLRKVRLGTFEDSGMCKGWAFLDFHTTAQAQAVLINSRNHHLNGRKLVLEFASADALRRGGHPSAFPSHSKEQEATHGTSKRIGAGKSPGYKKGKREQGHAGDESHVVEEDVPSAFPSASEETEQPAKRQKIARERPAADMTRGGKDRPVRRLKPGAALALAKQNVAKTGAIVASQGKKITF